MVIKKLILSGYKRLALNNINYLEYNPVNKVQLILGTNGSGKAQPLDAAIKIPRGWDTMRNMQIGTEVIAKDGTTANVIGVYPQGLKDIYKITFADGRSTKATTDHLWKVYVGGKKYPIEPTILTTLQIIELMSSKTYHRLTWIDLCDSEQNSDIDLPVDPYVLGVVLGDGCLSSSIVITHPDEFIMNKVLSRLDTDHKTQIRNIKDINKCLTYSITNNNNKAGPRSNQLINYFRECNLFGTRSWEKFIPEIYFNSSNRQRLELLQGLMDTDGTVDTQGSSSFSTTSKELAEGVQYLVRSLGGIAKIRTRYTKYTYQGEKKIGRQDYRVFIRHKRPEELFTLPKKKERTNNANQYSPTLKLRIEKIEYVGLRQAQCIAIDHPEHLYITDDFIVTHNTSLLFELGPLPADKNFYNKEGYKLIIIEHHNNTYELKSSFSVSGNRYNFIVNNEELNPSGTITIYKELVKQHFNITQDIHDLMIGSTVFHSMTVSERRNWLTKISDSDYTYAFKYYNSLKDQYRDIQGSMKISQSRLVQESDKLLTPKQEASHRTEINELKQFITTLLNAKQPLIDKQSIRNHLNTLEESISLMAKQLLEHNQLMLKTDLNDIAMIDELIIEIKSTILNQQERSTQSFNLIQQLRDHIVALDHSTVASVDDIDNQIDEVAKDVHHLKITKELNLLFDSPSTTLQALITIKEQIIDIFSQLPINHSRDFSRDHYAQVLEEYNRLLLIINNKDEDQLKLINIKRDLEHARDHQQIECPQCNHVWSKGYDIHTFERLISAIETQSLELDQLNIQRQALEASLEAHKAYSELFKQYRGLCYHWSILNPLWAYIASEDIIHDNPRYVIQLVNVLTSDLTIDIKVLSLNERISELLKVKALVEDNKELDVTKLNQQCEELEKELHSLTESIKQNKILLQEYDQYKIALGSIQRLSVEIENLIETRSLKANELMMTVKQEALNDTIQLLQLELNQKEQLISKIDIQKGIIENIEKQITEMTERQELLAIAIKELSPTEGLIAKGLTSFINSFVQQINSFISKIWLYPLELIPILPDENEDVDLDYKFSVRINDSFPISDISKGSSAMKEVIDLAFKIISAQYLNLADAPLYLDELGASMDKEHRKAAFYVINQLMTTSSFSQIFLISHYEHSYGSMNNADINVLSSANIEIPKDSLINQHLTMR